MTKSLVKSRESLVTQGEAIASSVKCTVYISTGETGLLSQQVLLHDKTKDNVNIYRNHLHVWSNGPTNAEIAYMHHHVTQD